MAIFMRSTKTLASPRNRINAIAAAHRAVIHSPRLKPPVLSSLWVAALACAATAATGAGPDLLHSKWPSTWITCPGLDPRSPVVCHFRREVTLGAVPGRYVVHVSADNRFSLYVNGARVGEGPARGDLDHWRYETFDIGPLLRAGPNELAATVWNCGALAPMAQMSDQTAFLLQGDTAAEADADTNGSWEVEEEKGQRFAAAKSSDLPNYYAASPGEVLDGALYDWDWNDLQSRGAWQHAVPVGAGEPGRFADPFPLGTGSGLNRWQLVQDRLPQMAYAEVPIGTIVGGTGSVTGFPATIPPHAAVTLLIDRGTMTTAFPVITVAGGKGSLLKVTYAEALVDSAGKKGNRNETAHRRILGLNDSFAPDGGAERTWSTLWWRAWRYLQVEVNTGSDPIEIRSVGARYSGYPFEEQASFEASDPLIARIWETGTRTARMNAHETYMDCPYWEQLQYIGDTRIQALLSYVEFGDDRLAVQALDAYDASRMPEGLTESRFPAGVRQVIPTFSLLWVGMLHDYWLYRPDAGRLKNWIPHTRGVLAWYAGHQRSDGLLGIMPWWNYGDWTQDFDFGVPPQDGDGGSALLSLDFMAALRDAADLEASLGNDALAGDYRRRADGIGKAVRELCRTPDGLLADTPAHAHFSEQTNAMGVLLDVVPKVEQAFVMGQVLANEEATPRQGPALSAASIYFRFYVARAMEHAGLSGRYLDSLGPWRKMLDLGLTTWAETAEPTRSDDHAWSAHPNYDLLTLVAGIHPASPGFRTVLIAPNPGTLTSLSARMAHPQGTIAVNYRKTGQAWTFDVRLPKGVTGTFQWDGQATPLAEGANTVNSVRR
jgi:alpha-L-rhamnosidase